MRNTLTAVAFAAGIGFVCCQSAGAAPANATAVQEAAAAASPLQQAQYAERRTRHGIVKCYRALVIGPYRCHYYPAPL
ncbi:MAG: hypothetical protein ACLPX7_11895 [Xanthobacteraceae bacterium]